MTRTRFTIIATMLFVIAMPAFATNGYFSHGQGTTNKALGGAGVAEPQDALAGEANPASLSLLDREFFNVAYHPHINTYNGSSNVEFVLADIQFE